VSNAEDGCCLWLLLEQLCHRVYAKVTVRYEGFTATARGNKMAYTLPIDKFIEVQIAYVDSHGNPAVIDGSVSWASSNPAALAVTVDPNDSTQATVTPQGALSSAQVVATADADLGAGIRQIITTLDITLVAGEAVAGTISVVGDPQPIPPARR
jgi:hypothetical protein